VKVAVGVIKNEAGCFLITQRSSDTTHPGFWEFPGGKVEQGESAEAALIREVQEEVGLTVIKHRFLREIFYQYDTYAVTLHCYLITHFFGDASCCESQLDMRWVTSDALSNYTFPAANQPLVAELTKSFID